MTLKQVTEALVFASPKPISLKEIVAALRRAGEASEDAEVQAFAKAKEAEVEAALAELQEELTTTGRAFQVVEKVNGWTLVSEPGCAIWVRQLYPEAKPTRLTGPQLETLAIIAYRQPVTRADIEAVRGVAVDGVMQVLLDRGLVKIAGRAELPGRPLLYSTTEYFLQHFGLKTTDELPNAGELKRVKLPTAPVEAAAAVDGAAAPMVDGAPADETPAAAASEAEPLETAGVAESDVAVESSDDESAASEEPPEDGAAETSEPPAEEAAEESEAADVADAASADQEPAPEEPATVDSAEPDPLP